MPPPFDLALPARKPTPAPPPPAANSWVLQGPNDQALAAHRVRLGHLAEGLALHLGWGAAQARQLRLAAPLHDVGERSAAIAPPLTPDEERLSRLTQPRRAAALLGGCSLPLFALAAEIALYHRERWDGSGYPQGLRGEEIPLSGRIVAVVDYFDALTMPHSYRPARADDRALAMLAEQSGSAFDPAIVASFLAHAPELIALRDSLPQGA